MVKNKSFIIKPGGVDEYIEKCPKDVQSNLQKIRLAIQSVAPGSIETVSYFQMPGYSYKGYEYNGMFVWFSYKEPFIRLHLRPLIISTFKNELTNYKTTKAIVNFLEDKDIPTKLVKKLVEASIKVMKLGNNKKT